jgi:hypothetical protein
MNMNARKMLKRMYVLATVLGLALAAILATSSEASVSAQTSDRPDRVRFLPDPVGQFEALSERADPLGLHIASSPNPSSCKHYQGAVRVQGADGTSFLIISRSGNLPDFEFSGTVCNDSPGETDNGHLIVFRMGSRDKYGERMRSNRLRKGVHVNATPPNPDDKASIFFTIVDGGLVFRYGEGGVPPKVYQHPGGMQVVGNVLALAVEHPRGGLGYDQAPNPTLVMFFDVSNPEDPMFLSQFPLVNRAGDALGVAGTVGITPLPDNHYLMMVTGGSTNATLYFYRSNVTDLKSPDLSWTFVDEWQANTARFQFGASDFCPLSPGSVEGPGGSCLSPDEQYLEQDWPDGEGGYTHQTLQFLRQGDVNGTLYLAGVRGKYGEDKSTVDLYRIDCETASCEGGEIKMKRIVSRDLQPYPNTGGTKLASFAAASTFYVSPSGELLLYVTEHDNDGPDGTVKAGEWRHHDIVREGSPTLLPTAVVDGPYEVDEGGKVSLSGSAKPPITKAWIQLYHETDFRSYYPVVDYDDYDLDDFDNFETLEYQSVLDQELTQADKAQSWRWFAPVGCSIQAIDHHGNVIDETRTLAGTGSTQRDSDLRLVPNDGDSDNVNQEIDAIDFLSNRDQYYATPFVLQWDLDGDGNYETTGSPVTLNAAAFDGPSNVAIPAQARHPAGGPVGPTTAILHVRNVAPTVASLALVDAFGSKVGTDVPFALVNLEYAAAGTFTDPGRPDHQTATLNFGDGATIPSNGFDSFNDAFGGATGQLRKSHTYKTPGTYTIRVEVTDDDGGQTYAETTIKVVSPIDVIKLVISQIDQQLAAATDYKVIRALRDARDDLAGKQNNPHRDGAVDKLEKGHLSSALSKIKDAIKSLEKAEAAGSGNLKGLKDLLGLASEAIAQQAYLEAVARVGSPSPGEAWQLQRIRQSITTGHANLGTGAYLAAIGQFKDAVCRAESLGQRNSHDYDDDCDD